MSYTPGPWKINKSKTRVWIEGTGRGCGVPRIAIVDDSAGTEPGNADLLASAPELLEALETLERCAGIATMEDDPARVSARKVIQKARGKE